MTMVPMSGELAFIGCCIGIRGGVKRSFHDLFSVHLSALLPGRGNMRQRGCMPSLQGSSSQQDNAGPSGCALSQQRRTLREYVIRQTAAAFESRGVLAKSKMVSERGGPPFERPPVLKSACPSCLERDGPSQHSAVRPVGISPCTFFVRFRLFMSMYTMRAIQHVLGVVSTD